MFFFDFAVVLTVRSCYYFWFVQFTEEPFLVFTLVISKGVAIRY